MRQLMYIGMRVCVTHTQISVTIQRNKDYKSDWEISHKGPNREYDKNIHQKNKQYLQQDIIF
jgi:hypothetical protein